MSMTHKTNLFLVAISIVLSHSLCATTANLESSRITTKILSLQDEIAKFPLNSEDVCESGPQYDS